MTKATPCGLLGALAWMTFSSAGFAAPSSTNPAPEPRVDDAPASTATAPRRDVSGARFKFGAFGLAHARRPSGSHPESTAFAPGVSLGVGWRLGSWELDARARAAYWQGGPGYVAIDRRTMFGSLGGRARWFLDPNASLAPFLEVGADVLVLSVDMMAGIGPSGHVGAGLELWHDAAHHRLAMDVGVDIPAFRMEGGATTLASWFSSPTGLYVVPVAVAANWTF
jgi:hypothetical protein